MTTRTALAPVGVLSGVQVEDERDGRLGARVVEGLPGGGPLEGDAEDRRPEATGLGGRVRADLPAAIDEAFGDGALPLDMQAGEGLAHERGELGAAADEDGGLDEAEQRGGGERRAHERADVGARS